MIRNQNGFTVMELSLYVTLVAVVLVMATSFAWNIINSRAKAFAVQEVEQNGRYILEKISQATRQATDISAPSTGTTGTALTLVMKNAAQSPTVFSLSGNQLTMAVNGAPAVSLHSPDVKITNLTFTNLSSANGKSRHVRIQFTVQTVNPSGRNEYAFVDSFETSVELLDR